MKKTYLIIFLLLLPVLMSACGAKSQSEVKYNMSVLTSAQQGIVPIASYAAIGDLENLKTALNDGLNAGMTVNQIKEILIQVYAYAGFPRSLNAINTFMVVMDEREKAGIKDIIGNEGTPLNSNINKYDFGERVQTELIGAPYRDVYQDFAPAIGVFLKEHLFADIFGRGVLTYQEREIATVSMLATIQVNDQLRSHMNFAMNTGLTEEQIWTVIAILEAKVSKSISKNADEVYTTLLHSMK